MITDKMMTDAAEELYQALLSSLPEESECVHQFSQGFERKMNRLIRRMEHPVRHRVLQRAASIALVLFLGFMALLAVSPTVRAAVFGWVRERYEGFMTYYFRGEVTENTEHFEYELGILPAGFVEALRTETENKVTVNYSNATTKQYISFTYFGVDGEYSHNIDGDNATIESVSINEMIGDFYYCGDSSQSKGIIWIDEENNTLFSIIATLEKDELIALAENVKIK